MPTPTTITKLSRPDVDMLPVSTDSFDLFFRHMDRLLKPAPKPKPAVFERPARERFPTLAAIGFIFDARESSLVCPTCGGPAKPAPCEPPNRLFEQEYNHVIVPEREIGPRPRGES